MNSWHLEENLEYSKCVMNILLIVLPHQWYVVVEQVALSSLLYGEKAFFQAGMSSGNYTFLRHGTPLFYVSSVEDFDMWH